MNFPYLPIRAFLTICLCLAAACAQESPQPSAVSASYSMDQLAQRAGIIFSGTVTSIETSDDSVVRITFQVLDGLRGARAGEEIVIREWVSARAPANQRYRVGESVLVFFHPVAESGLTSPVGGATGIVRFSGAGTLKFSDAQSLAVLRSPRLSTALGGSTQGAKRTLPAGDFLRALRLVVESPGNP